MIDDKSIQQIPHKTFERTCIPLLNSTQRRKVFKVQCVCQSYWPDRHTLLLRKSISERKGGLRSQNEGNNIGETAKRKIKKLQMAGLGK